MLKEAIADLNRVRQIALIAARHGFGSYLERGGLGRALGRKEAVEVPKEIARQSAARRFRLFLSDLGPTFVKLGQILSTRSDLLPAEVIAELTELQDRAPVISLADIRKQIQAGLGKPPEELFRSLDETPLGAASIAQVHRAVTLTGDEVVVKVQRPGIAAQIHTDMALLRTLARFLEAVIEETGVSRPSGIVDEFERAITEELNFKHEADNIRAFYETHRDRDYVRIPRVYDSLSCDTVLTMEFMSGTRLRDADLDDEAKQTIARNIVDGAFRQIFVDGLFHGDPHPGNMLVHAPGVVALLDFGLVGRISPEMKQTLVMLVMSVALRDAESVARLLYKVGVPDTRADLMGFRRDIEQILNRYLPGSLSELNARALTTDLMDLAVKYGIRVPKEYAILSRAAISTEGLLRTLAPDLPILEVAMPYVKELLAERWDPTLLRGGLMRTLLRFQGLANDLPTQLSQILLDMQMGKFAVTVRADQIGRLNDSLRSAAFVAFLGLCACGFIVGGFMAFVQKPWTIWGIPVLGVIGIAIPASLFGAVLTWYLFGGKLRKIRLTKWR